MQYRLLYYYRDGLMLEICRTLSKSAMYMLKGKAIFGRTSMVK